MARVARLRLVRRLEAAAAGNALAAVDVFLVGADDVLRLVAPASARAGIGRALGLANLAGYVHRLAAEMDARRRGDLRQVKVQLERHETPLSNMFCREF